MRRVTWRRVLDVNDRALRDVVVGLGGPGNGYPRESGFDIVVASEVMAIFCLATGLADLKERLGDIVIGYTRDRQPVRARDLGAHGAMTAMLRDALAPNLVQTLENTPAFVHGGPFANIAHGCNSLSRRSSALHLADYVVTEAGFGADLGAEKFIDILCRTTGLRPSAAVIVATVRAMKYHGGVEVADLPSENVAALERGIVNLERHLDTVRETFGLPAVVAINHRAEDTEAEVAAARRRRRACRGRWRSSPRTSPRAAPAPRSSPAKSSGCARSRPSSALHLSRRRIAVGEDAGIATRIYGASEITARPPSARRSAVCRRRATAAYPVCVAKTQYSFSTDPKLRGAPSGHVVDIREVRLAAGARVRRHGLRRHHDDAGPARRRPPR